MYASQSKSWFDYAASGNKQISIVFSSAAGPKTADKFPWEAGSTPPPFMIKLQAEAAAAREAGLSDPSMRARSNGRGGGARRVS